MHPKKRWYSISLFTLFILLSLACACLAVYANIVVRGEAQKAAIDGFRKTHTSLAVQQSRTANYRAFFVYDYQIEAYDSSQLGMFGPLPSPHWLAGWVGVDFVHNIELVDFDGLADEEQVKLLQDFPGLKTVIIANGFTGQRAWDALVRCRSLEEIQYDIYWHENVPIKFQNLSDLNHLREFQIRGGELEQVHLSEIAAAKSIRTLRLINIHIKRSNLLQFPKMKQIESFFWNVSDNSLDDDEFHFLENFPNLKELAIAGANELTDAVFQTIEKLSSLQELSLHGTDITGAQLDRLKKLPQLKKLELGASSLNDAGLKNLAQMSQLTQLEIGSTDVTDKGMKFVVELSNLKHLSIRDTEISDTGLQRLLELPKLNRLLIRDTRISKTAVADFKKQRPKCLVEQK